MTSIVWLLASLNSFFALWSLKSCSISSATNVKGTLNYICCAYFHFHFFVFVVEEYICCFHIVWNCTHCKWRFLPVVQDDLVLDVRRDCLRIQSVCKDLSVVVSYILSSPHFDVLISKNKLTPQPQFPLFFSFCQNSVEQK